jgi:ribokinase
MKEHKYDVLAIGDIVSEPFIKIGDNYAIADFDQKAEKRTLTIEYGTKIPIEEVHHIVGVGNSANAAVACSRLGLSVGMITDIGADSAGMQIINHLIKEEIGVEFVKVHPDYATNQHYVLWYKDDRTILVKHENYPYKMPKIDVSSVPKWIYLSSFSNNGFNMHSEIVDFMKQYPEVKLTFQPGSYQMMAGFEQLAQLYSRTTFFVVNKEEAAMMTGLHASSIKEMMVILLSKGPKYVSITDGPNGAYFGSRDDRDKVYYLPIYPDIMPPIERTGCGDSFAATITAAMAAGLSFEDALYWGPINSMMVVQKIGAQAGLMSRAELLAYLGKAPEQYRLTLI